MMSDTAYALFETRAGRTGIAWGPAGVVASCFPGGEDARILRHLTKRAPGAVAASPPAEIADVIRRYVALFETGAADFADVAIDFAAVSEFDARVYGETRKIPSGETGTYGDIARKLGDVAYSQRVGQALGANPFPVIVPCHRVVGLDGRMTGFSAPGGIAAKEKLLKLEGALAPDLFDAQGGGDQTRR